MAETGILVAVAFLIGWSASSFRSALRRTVYLIVAVLVLTLVTWPFIDGASVPELTVRTALFFLVAIVLVGGLLLAAGWLGFWIRQHRAHSSG